MDARVSDDTRPKPSSGDVHSTASLRHFMTEGAVRNFDHAVVGSIVPPTGMEHLSPDECMAIARDA